MDHIISYQWHSEIPLTQLSHLYLPRTDGAGFRSYVPGPESRLPKMLCVYNNCYNSPSNRPNILMDLQRRFPVECRGEHYVAYATGVSMFTLHRNLPEKCSPY